MPVPLDDVKAGMTLWSVKQRPSGIVKLFRLVVDSTTPRSASVLDEEEGESYRVDSIDGSLDGHSVLGRIFGGLDEAVAQADAIMARSQANLERARAALKEVRE